VGFVVVLELVVLELVVVEVDVDDVLVVGPGDDVVLLLLDEANGNTWAVAETSSKVAITSATVATPRTPPQLMSRRLLP
jgi:hypothetical protein